jgi:hypothetical protein
MRQAYVQKKLYCRHLCKTFDFQITCNNYSFHTDIIKEQIATGKGFSAHTPVIHRIFQVNNIYRDSSPLSPVLILMASLRS